MELIYEYLIKPSEPTENPLQTQMNIANVSGAITNILNAKPDISDVNNLEQSNNLGKNAVNQSSTLGSSRCRRVFFQDIIYQPFNKLLSLYIYLHNDNNSNNSINFTYNVYSRIYFIYKFL